MKRIVIYVHGKGGSPNEASHYKTIFKGATVVGLCYKAETPWEAKEEFPPLFDSLTKGYDSVVLIANSIGAFFSMHSLSKKKIDEAFFISPIVDMGRLIKNMMVASHVTEVELEEKRTIKTSFGETLSYEYLDFVRSNPIVWKKTTHILYGEKDELTSFESIVFFAKKVGATLSIMENGEHWFHTDEQMEVLDNWIKALLM